MMAALTPTTPSQKKGNGKGLVWSDKELLALAHGAPKVCLNPAVGKGCCGVSLGTNSEMNSSRVHCVPQMPALSKTRKTTGTSDDGTDVRVDSGLY